MPTEEIDKIAKEIEKLYDYKKPSYFDRLYWSDFVFIIPIMFIIYCVITSIVPSIIASLIIFLFITSLY